MRRYVTALTIAGSDSSGGAGIQADIKTMSAIGVYASTAITAVTVQNTLGVRNVQGINPDVVAGQIDAVFDDIRPDAVKIGMLFGSAIVKAVAVSLSRNQAQNIVLDPVMVSTSGSKLINDEAIRMIKELLIPQSAIVTPNVAEAYQLTGTTDQQEQIEYLHGLGAKAVLLKGGDALGGNPTKSIDVLSTGLNSQPIILESDRIATNNTHGTGCTLSSAIASYLALGFPVEQSVAKAKDYIDHALLAGSDVNTGHGHGPVNHLFNPHHLRIIET